MSQEQPDNGTTLAHAPSEFDHGASTAFATPAGPVTRSRCRSSASGEPDFFVLVKREGMPAAGLSIVSAQALSAMLAFTVPSPQTAVLGVVLLRAAGIAFRLLGRPEVGPAENAINPWKSDC
ncbi:hypothetical protein ACIBP6_03570 [Nonomuraea terrae]|uniref:hypothetical protein n=1 Tax=Nonomuraea terrae TaxID=2530383 RepID=UPI00378F45F8